MKKKCVDVLTLMHFQCKPASFSTTSRESKLFFFLHLSRDAKIRPKTIDMEFQWIMEKEKKTRERIRLRQTDFPGLDKSESESLFLIHLFLHCVMFTSACTKMMTGMRTFFSFFFHRRREGFSFDSSHRNDVRFSSHYYSLRFKRKKFHKHTHTQTHTWYVDLKWWEIVDFWVLNNNAPDVHYLPFVAIFILSFVYWI